MSPRIQILQQQGTRSGILRHSFLVQTTLSASYQAHSRQVHLDQNDLKPFRVLSFRPTRCPLHDTEERVTFPDTSKRNAHHRAWRIHNNCFCSSCKLEVCDHWQFSNSCLSITSQDSGCKFKTGALAPQQPIAVNTFRSPASYPVLLLSTPISSKMPKLAGSYLEQQTMTSYRCCRLSWIRRL